MIAACDVACVAGSFVPVGGHNMIEPAAVHKPIVTGPYVFNFAEVSDFMLQANGMVKVADAMELADTILNWFSHPDACWQAGENAYQVVARNRGALQRQINLIDLSLERIFHYH